MFMYSLLNQNSYTDQYLISSWEWLEVEVCDC